MAIAQGTHKNVALESLRGLASVGVLIWHSLMAFFPGRTGIWVVSNHAWNTAPWFGLINGAGWVTFFFVLSGYVLTRSALLAGDPAPVVRNMLKRWPRLAVPVLLAVLGSWALFATGAYRYPEAGALAGSPWLVHGGGMRPPGPPDIWEAILQGSVTTFFRGDHSYDSSLWTMQVEFLGSFIAFGMALLLLSLRQPAARLYLAAMLAGLCLNAPPFLMTFPAGVALAAFLPRRRGSGLPLPAALAMACAGIFLLGYTGVQAGAFRWVAALWPQAIRADGLNTVGAVLLVLAVEQSASLHIALSHRWGAWLGRLSFPLYLVHVPVICSVGAACYLGMHPDPGAWLPRLAACAIGAAVALAAACPLMWANEWWVARLNRLASRKTRASCAARIRVTPRTPAGQGPDPLLK